jgi:glycosyltransferase involved in cell wall biosynthesis
MVNSNLAGGEDIPAILEGVGIPQERVLVADQYRVLFDPYGHESMAKIYSAMDVLLNPAMGEGFGVPVLEAQACGVPVIVTDFSAMREVCGAGWAVKHSPYWTGLNSWQAVPDVDDIASALEECYGLSATKREKMSISARRHAMDYALPKVLKQHMLPSLRTAWDRFESQQPVRIAPRAKAAA